MTPKELVDILTEEDKLEGLKDAQMADINVVQNAIVRALPQDVSSKVDFHQSGIEKGTRERVRSKVAKFGYHYKFLSSF